MTIRLLVSDIDGTLVTKDKELTQVVRDAAGQLAEAGIKLVLVSSRPPHGVALFADALRLDTPRAAFNGGVFTSADGALLRTELLAEEAAREALAYLKEQGISLWLFTPDAWLLTDADGDYVSWEQRTVRMDNKLIKTLYKNKFNIFRRLIDLKSRL